MTETVANASSGEAALTETVAPGPLSWGTATVATAKLVASRTKLWKAVGSTRRTPATSGASFFASVVGYQHSYYCTNADRYHDIKGDLVQAVCGCCSDEGGFGQKRPVGFLQQASVGADFCVVLGLGVTFIVALAEQVLLLHILNGRAQIRHRLGIARNTQSLNQFFLQQAIRIAFQSL